MWSNIFASVASYGLRIHQTILPNVYFWYFITKISLQDSDAKSIHSIKDLRPHYKLMVNEINEGIISIIILKNDILLVLKLKSGYI